MPLGVCECSLNMTSAIGQLLEVVDMQEQFVLIQPHQLAFASGRGLDFQALSAVMVTVQIYRLASWC